MDSVDQRIRVTEGSWRDKRKRGRPRKYRLGESILHSVSPLPIAESPPPGFPSRTVVFPVKNLTPPATGLASAGGSQDKPRHSGVSEKIVSCAKHNLAACPQPEYKINMEPKEITARQVQSQMHRFASTVAELGTDFETAKKKLEELEKQVPDLDVQIQKWNDQKAIWAEKMKELERERDKAREETLKALGEKRDLEKKFKKVSKEAEDAKASAKKAKEERLDLEVKLEEAAKQTEDVEASAKTAIDKAALKFVEEKRNLEEKLEKAVKQVEDAQASGKKSISEAVASTTNYVKICLDNFVASLGNGEDKSLEDYVNKLVKVIPCEDGALANGAVDVAGYEGDGDRKDDAAMELRMSQRATKPNPKYV